MNNDFSEFDRYHFQFLSSVAIHKEQHIKQIKRQNIDFIAEQMLFCMDEIPHKKSEILPTYPYCIEFWSFSLLICTSHSKKHCIRTLIFLFPMNLF